MKLSDLYNKQPTAKEVRTRFRAYKLGKAGSLCSYFAGNYFTLIEATGSEISRPSLQEELKVCGKDHIDTLHITSWDQDHCEAGALEWILDTLKPTRIQTPGYVHDTQSAKSCQTLIAQYKTKRQQIGKTANVISITPQYISSLGKAEALGYQDIMYHPKSIYTDSNNNSTVNFFRSGCFNVLSTGDIEHHDIGSYLRNCKTLKREIDVLLLPHHGAPVDLMTKKFLEELRPSVVVCTSNTANQHEHPHPSIRRMLGELSIPLMTTKRGDVIIESIGSHISRYQASDLLSDGETSQEDLVFTARKFRVMSMNGDTIRDRLGHRNTGPRGTIRR
jgi:competence protein ComEC